MNNNLKISHLHELKCKILAEGTTGTSKRLMLTKEEEEEEEEDLDMVMKGEISRKILELFE